MSKEEEKLIAVELMGVYGSYWHILKTQTDDWSLMEELFLL